MYAWRKLSSGQRDELLRYRKQRQWPWHGPPHTVMKDALFHITAVNFEHRCITGKSMHRIDAFGGQLMEALAASGGHCMSWCVLPNHYHLLVLLPIFVAPRSALGSYMGGHPDNGTWRTIAQDDSAGIAVQIAQYDPRGTCGQR